MAKQLTPDQLSKLSRSERKRYERRVAREGSAGDQSPTTPWSKYRYPAMAILVLLILGGGLIYLARSYHPKILPPTTMAGHIEQSPPVHILDEPMDVRVQKHMLEHADGDGPPGVIINYNCLDFECRDDLIPNLIEIVQDYPDHVYLAPYRGMTVMIALTKLGKIKTLDQFDEKAVRAFIESD